MLVGLLGGSMWWSATHPADDVVFVSGDPSDVEGVDPARADARSGSRVRELEAAGYVCRPKTLANEEVVVVGQECRRKGGPPPTADE